MAKGFKTFKKIIEQAHRAGAPKERLVDGERVQLKLRTTPVTWGVPFDEIGFNRFWTKFIATANMMPWDGWLPQEGTYLQKARNEIHNKFLKSNSPYLMMLDSDIMFPPDLVDRLMAHNKPLVGGWYKDKQAREHWPTVYDFVEEKDDLAMFRHRDKPGVGLEKVDAMGAGCWLMKREVAEALGETPYGDNIAKGGEDFIFCRKLMKLGIDLHVDWSINCAHWGVGYY